MPGLDLQVGAPSPSAQQQDAPQAPLSLKVPAARPAAGDAAGVLHASTGGLLVFDASGDAVRLAAGDPVLPGDVLITRAGGHARVALEGGASVAIDGEASVEIVFAGDRGVRMIAYGGAFVVAAPGEATTLTVETGAAILTLQGGALGFRYGSETGLSGALVTDGRPAGTLHVVNDSGAHVVNGANPAFAVAAWSEPPTLRSDGPDAAASAGGAPGELPGELPGDGGDAAEALVEPGGSSSGADADGGPALSTGAGTAEEGDPAFVSAPSSAAPAARGLADFTPVAAPMPPPGAAFVAPPPRTVASATDHDVDALFLWQPPAAPAPAPLPPSPPVEPAPHIRGWEPRNSVWDTLGSAWVSGGGRELPADEGLPRPLIRPTEGDSMARLEPLHAASFDLEPFLGLRPNALNQLVDGAIAFDGSAIRTSVDLKAGETLVFDVLFDAVERLPSNDFAAFTVARAGTGEAFAFASNATTGVSGVSWQTLRYTAAVKGTYTIGFVAVNDGLADGPPRLFVDGMRTALGTSDLSLVASKAGAGGASFELFAPAPEDPRGAPRLLEGFEGRMEPYTQIGQVMRVGQMIEPDGSGGIYAPTEGSSMAVLHARGGMRATLESFLQLDKAPGAVTALPVDADGSLPSFGAATKITVSVAAGDRISFDWMFDAGDRLPKNDCAFFTVSAADGSRLFKLADVATTGDAGATGWRTSVYTAAGDGELALGFAVVNDGASGLAGDPANSRLLVDNVWLNRDFAGYQLADLTSPGELAALATG